MLQKKKIFESLIITQMIEKFPHKGAMSEVEYRSENADEFHSFLLRNAFNKVGLV